MTFSFGRAVLLLVTEFAPKPLEASKSVSALAPAMITILFSPEEHLGAGLSSSLLGPRILWPGGAGTLPGFLMDQSRFWPVRWERGPQGWSGVFEAVSEGSGEGRRRFEGVWKLAIPNLPTGGQQSLTGCAQSRERLRLGNL